MSDPEMILEVDEPLEVEHDRTRPGQVLLIHLRLAADRACMSAHGWREALRRDPALALGPDAYDGELTDAPVAAAHGTTSRPVAEVLA